MKITNLFLLGIFLLTSTITQSQSTVTSKIDQITLYLDGAKITRTASLKLTKGEQKIVISDLSEKLEEKTVRINANKGTKILSVTTKNNYLSTTTDGVLLSSLKDSIAYLEGQNQELRDQMDALTTEKDVLLTNKKLSSENNYTVEQLKQMVDFFGKRTLEINKKTSELNGIKMKNDATITKYRNHLTSNSSVRTKSFKEVVIVIKSESAQTTSLQLEYLVNSAGWVPTYDLRVDDLSKPIELNYKAHVYNNTGVNWSNAKFVLSTTDPRKSATQPTLKTWVIRNNSYDRDNNNMGNYNAGYSENDKKSVVKDGITYEEIDIPELSMHFDIEELYSIPSDAQPYTIDVTNYQLKATFKHFAAPKVEEAVFLLARISGWESYNLIEGNANIYFSGNYVGESYIKTSGANDTLNISLGRDNKVSVQRTKIKDYTDSKLIGNSKKDLLEFEFKVKNLRTSPVEIEIVDQIPVSGDDEIIIEATEISAALKNEKTGLLTWQKKIEPDQTVQWNLAFSIRYPKNMSYAKQQTMRSVKAKF